MGNSGEVPRRPQGECRIDWQGQFGQNFRLRWTVWPNAGILYFNNELLNYVYQYLFGKQSIIEKLHDMTNKLQMTSMAYISYNNNFHEL